MTLLPLLMVSYLFPPQGGGGVQRSVKFAKYLPKQGYEPIVVTTAKTNAATADNSYAHELPKRIIRIPEAQRGRLATKIIEILSFPDIHGAWGRKAVHVCRELVTANNIRILYSTAGPYQNHVVARAVARSCGIAWVADFRDLWTTNPVYVPPTPLHRLVHRWFERRFYQDASAVVCASPTQKQNIIERFKIAEEKLHVITNGFDPTDIASQKSDTKQSDTLRMTYLGSFYAGYRPDDFVRAVEVLQKNNPTEFAKLSVRFIGDFDRKTKRLLQESTAREAFTVENYMPHGELARIRQMTDIHFLYLPAMKGPIGAMIPQKLYEYLASNKPIFGVLPDSDAREILEHTGGAVLVMPGDPNKIAAALLETIKLWEKGTLPLPSKAIGRFMRERLTEQLAHVLESVS